MCGTHCSLLIAHCSKAPHDSGRCAVIVLRVAGVMRMHVVALHTPGEVLDEEFIVRATADVDDQRAPYKSAGIQTANTCRRLDERSPPSGIDEKTRASDRLVLGHPLAIKAAAI